jgi:hypothetical protein
MGVRQRDPAHLPALDALQAIDRCQCLVDKRIVALDEGREAPVLAEDALEEQARLVDHRRSESGRHLGKLRSVEGLAGQLVETEPLGAEAIEERPRPRIGNEPAGLRGQHLRIVKRPPVRDRRKLRVGHRRPQQVGQARRELMVAETDVALAASRSG